MSPFKQGVYGFLIGLGGWILFAVIGVVLGMMDVTGSWLFFKLSWFFVFVMFAVPAWFFLLRPLVKHFTKLSTRQQKSVETGIRPEDR